MKLIGKKDGWIIYDRSEELQRPRPMAEPTDPVEKPEAPDPPPEPGWSDPKTYNKAPFSIEDRNEDVVLNSGALILSYEDLVLPGRNGFDLRFTRQYDSSRANTEDINLYYDDEDGDRWNSIVYDAMWQPQNPIMYVRVEDSFYYWESKSDMLNEIEDSYNDPPDWVDYDEVFEDGQGYYRGYIWTVPAKSEVFLRTSKRPNDHFKNLYGLGYGWRFMFPSIEKVLVQDYRNRYRTFVHFENGLSLAINEDENGFEDYPLNDYTLSKSNNTYVVGYKDGQKAFFDTNNRLTHMTDRFGNQITFAYDSTGRMNQITDSFGRVILLELSGSTLTLKRQDTSEVLFTYTISSDGQQLLSTTDKAGRVTSYAYTVQVEPSQMSREETGDTPVDITYVNLTTVTHPTGAQSIYTYGYQTDVYPTPYEGEHTYFVLRGRKELPNPLEPTTVCYERSYSYSTAEASKTEEDEDGNPLFGQQDWGAPYVDQATILSYKNASGGFDVKQVTTFGENGFKENEILYHIVEGVEKRMEQHEYAFTDRLLITQLDSYLNEDYSGVEDNTNIWQRITQYTYTTDKKGNPTQIMEEYPARPSCNQEKNFIYDSNFSIPVEQSVLTADGRYTITRDTLRAETDGLGKVPEYRRILEKVNGVETLKEKTQFTYDSNYRVTNEKRFYGDDLETSTTAVETVYTYGNYTDEPVSSQVSGVADIGGTLITSVNGVGVVKSTAVYDWFGRAASQTDPNGNTTVTTYDGIGRVTQVTNSDATTKTTVYNDTANTITITDENGNAHRYEYTPLGQIEKDYILSPEALLVEYQYDSQGRKVKEITYQSSGAAKATAQYTYDLFDKVLTKQITGTGVNTSETHTYNRAYTQATTLERTVTTGDEGAPTVTKYVLTDPLGNVVSEQIADLVTNYSYDRAGNRTLKVDPRGCSTAWTYDYAGRVVEETNAVGRSALFEYDALGRKTKDIDLLNRETLYTYDLMGRLLQKETPFQDETHAFTRYFYDPAGNLIRHSILRSEEGYEPGWDEYWGITDYTYDSRNRVVDTIFYDEDVVETSRTRFEYDGVGNKTAQYVGLSSADSTDGAQKTVYTYNRFGKIASMVDPVSSGLASTDPSYHVESYVYDNVGVLQSKTDRNGVTTSYTYDALDRVLTETVGSGETAEVITHTYTKTGKVRSLSNATLTITNTYDPAERLIQVSESDGTVKEYSYDESGNRIAFQLTYDGEIILKQTYLYDDLNRLVEMGENGTAMVKYSYDAVGNRTMMQYPGKGIYTGYQYNDANLVVMVDNYYGSENELEQYTYRLDGVLLDNNCTNSRSYRYDMQGRITRDSSYDRNTIDFEYDRYGNRSLMEVDDYDEYEVEYEYDANNRLITETKTDRSVDPEVVTVTTYTYDANGNQLTRTNSVDGTETRTYNGIGQLVSVTSGGQTVSFAYRPDGLRYSKTSGSGTSAVTHKHLWDGQNIVAEIGVTDTVNSRYIRGQNLVARKIDSNHEYYLFNYHGDVIRRLDSYGNLLRYYDYDAFGIEYEPEALDSNRETGNYYLRARYLDPLTGRFTTEDVTRTRKMNVYDPYGYYPDAALLGGVFRDEEKKQYVVEDPQGLNLYTYCHNNPTMFTDPLGKFAIAAVVGVAIGGVVGGALGALGAKISGTSIFGGAVGGAVSGILTALIPGSSILVGAMSAFGGSMIGSLVENLFNDEKASVKDILVDAGISGIFGVFGSSLGKLMDDKSFTEVGKKLAGGFVDWIFGHVEISISAIKDMLFPKKSYAS